ncbi:MAG: heavy metal translocating P-type ATPase [Pseudomonadota bacterium]
MTDVPADMPETGCPAGLAPPTRSAHSADLSAFVRVKDGLHKLDLSIRGAKCGGCIAKIETAVRALEGVTAVRVNLSNGTLSVTGNASLSANGVAATVAGLGYGVTARSTDTAESEHKKEERKLLVAMGVAGFATANIMLLSVSVWGGQTEMGEQTRTTFHALSGLIALPVVLFSGQHFFASALGALKHRSVNMDVPISLAILLAFGVSIWETVHGGTHAYFDACVMLLFFLLIGRFLDARLRRRAFAAAHELAAIRNRPVTRITGDRVEAVRSDEIEPGDRILVAQGEQVVIDIEVTGGGSEVDESLVTGESLPNYAAKGTKIYSGSVNLGDPLEGKALSTADDSLLADISALLESGEQRRSTYRRIADRAVSLYVPFVHTTAFLAFAGWLLLGAGVREATMIAASTLIITCPCALALAAPVAQMVAAGNLFRAGTFLKSGDALERISEIDYVVFDKTGTLTIGVPRWCPTKEAEGALMSAAQLARASRHPLSRALVSAAGPGILAKNVTEEPGSGLRASIAGVEHRLGSASWVGSDAETQHSGPALWYRQGDGPAIPFIFEDAVHVDAHRAIGKLQARGLGIEILSGDKEDAVFSMARRLGIERWKSAASPQDKAARLEDLAAEGRKVLMVGDGLNDAAALSLAHAALAPGGAIDVSQASADAVYSGGLSTVPHTLHVAAAAKHITLQNFGLAAAYNFIAVPIAVTGHVTPLIAAIAMSASSLIVTLNALRMQTGRAPKSNRNNESAMVDHATGAVA